MVPPGSGDQPARHVGWSSGVGLGVYLHIPFCRHRCDYCAFAAWDDRHHLTDRYMQALRSDVASHVVEMAEPVTTVFVGGGTPSLVPGHQLAEVLGLLPVAPGAEVTVEMNPEDATAELLATYRQAGVTRISMGVQSMAPSVLGSLGRQHRVDAVGPAVAEVRAAGFESFNLDLIYGAAGETLEDWSATLEAVLALDPPHVSAYALTIEPGTPLATDHARHPDDDDQAAKYAMAEDMLGGAGLPWYEISNWARPGHECRHNLRYWDGGNYLGLGCGAHSHLNGRRWWNVRTPERYADAIEQSRDPTAGSEELDADHRRLELLQLALRTRRGVPSSALRSIDLDGVLAGLVVSEDGRLVLTLQGRLLANEVALRLA